MTETQRDTELHRVTKSDTEAETEKDRTRRKETERKVRDRKRQVVIKKTESVRKKGKKYKDRER